MERRAQIVGLYKAGPTMGQLITRDANRAREAARLSRKASYATARLVAAPRGVPLYATGRGQMGRGEVKFFDQRVTAPVSGNPYGLFTAETPPVAAAGPGTAFTGITCLNLVQQGATSYNRIGAKILVKSVDFRACLFLGGTEPVSNWSRVMLVWDKQPNGAYPVFSDILSDNISTAPDFSSGLNMANKDRFTILRNQVFSLTADGGNRAIDIKWFVKTRIETMFKANTGAIGDITTGAIYLVAFSNFSSAAAYGQLSEMQCRIRFYD